MTDAVLEEILEELEETDPQCLKCETPMVTNRHWRRASAAERAELIEDGYVRPGARGYCRPCYRTLTPEQLAEALPLTRTVPKAGKVSSAVLREVARTLGAGGTMQSVATKYGLTHSTLDAAYRRGQRKGIIP